MTDHSIKGKTVLIAGGAKNLGRLIARDLAAQGAKAIAVHYNTSATKPAADDTVAAIKAAGADAFAFQGDLTTAGAVEKLFAEAKAAMGKKWTGFTDEEEKEVNTAFGMTLNNYTIQSEAAGIAGTSFLCRGANEPFTVRDGRLITGQQQYSSAITAELVMEALDEF